MMRRRPGACAWIGVWILAVFAAACGGSEPDAPALATPSLTLAKDRVPAGSPVEVTYRFTVAPDATFDGDYWVMVHVVDSEGERMWGDDHQPPIPTSQWKPGQTVEYTRTVFAPIFPYIGEAGINMGLYMPASQVRLPLGGEHVGQRAYRVGRFQLLPQTDNLFTVFKEGWHPAEVAPEDTLVEWQWTKKEATLAFRNPKRDAKFYLDLDNPAGYVGAQRITVRLGEQTVDEFTIQGAARTLRTMTLPATTLGTDDITELRITVDPPFTPAQTGGSNSTDPRELGVRVFHAFVEAP
jgi:hypothetical protein